MWNEQQGCPDDPDDPDFLSSESDFALHSAYGRIGGSRSNSRCSGGGSGSIDRSNTRDSGVGFLSPRVRTD